MSPPQHFWSQGVSGGAGAFAGSHPQARVEEDGTEVGLSVLVPQTSPPGPGKGSLLCGASNQEKQDTAKDRIKGEEGAWSEIRTQRQ